MDLFDAEILAKTLISHYNPGVQFAWSRTKKSYGDYFWSRNLIRLSSVLIPLMPIEEVTNVIMHEIAHSLCPPGEGHGPKWRAQMIKFGLKPERCSTTSADLAALPGNWYAVCPKHGRTGDYFLRKPRLARSCTRCYPGRYNAEYKVIWHQVTKR